MRQHITRALIERKGFNVVAIEADWPDAERGMEGQLQVTAEGAATAGSMAR